VISRATRVVVAAALLAGSGAVAARAQGRPPGAGRQGEARREEAFRMVDAYVVSNLQSSLGLSDEQYTKVLPLVTRLQSERRGYLMERARLLREMRRLLDSGAATEADVTPALQRLRAVEADGPARVHRDMEALDAALSPVQQAKYRLLELDVEQRLRDLMGRLRANRPGAGGLRQ